MSNYCGLCNGHLNGPLCHKNLIDAENEISSLLAKLKIAEEALESYSWCCNCGVDNRACACSHTEAKAALKALNEGVANAKI